MTALDNPILAEHAAEIHRLGKPHRCGGRRDD
jgi:hypothetical protein